MPRTGVARPGGWGQLARRRVERRPTLRILGADVSLVLDERGDDLRHVLALVKRGRRREVQRCLAERVDGVRVGAWEGRG